MPQPHAFPRHFLYIAFLGCMVFLGFVAFLGCIALAVWLSLASWPCLCGLGYVVLAVTFCCVVFLGCVAFLGFVAFLGCIAMAPGFPWLRGLSCVALAVWPSLALSPSLAALP